jgi:catechol 2,3-dioxygenase-like lactoylglutathione lyase family enzyme
MTGNAMTDHATPNLPARDFGATSDFYRQLGFDERYRDHGWMILEKGGLKLEFFPFPDLDPSESSFGSCLRLDDLDGFYTACRAAALPETKTGFPRIVPPRTEHWGGRVGYLVDPDGTLLRLVQN